MRRLLLAAALAEDHNQRGDWITKAEALSAKGPPVREVLLARALHRRASPSYEEAFPYFDRLLARDPDDLAAIQGRVELYGMAGLPRTALATLEKPVLAMIHGHCIGGGVAIALTADARYAAEDAVFAIPAARLGLGYHMAGLEALVNLVGPSRAKEIFFTARRFTAAEACEMGLVNAVAPRENVLEAALARAQRIATLPPLAIRSAKILAQVATEAELPGGLAAERQTVAFLFATEDRREGLAAHRAHRPARFTGR